MAPRSEPRRLTAQEEGRVFPYRWRTDASAEVLFLLALERANLAKTALEACEARPAPALSEVVTVAALRLERGTPERDALLWLSSPEAKEARMASSYRQELDARRRAFEAALADLEAAEERMVPGTPEYLSFYAAREEWGRQKRGALERSVYDPQPSPAYAAVRSVRVR